VVAEFEHRARQVAFDFLAEHARIHGEVLPKDVLQRHVRVGDETFPVAVFQRGIFKPRQLDGALTLVTAPPKANEPPPYADRFGPDELFHYHYEGSDPNLWTNRAVRFTMENRLPLIYLFGITPGYYLPVWPVHVVGEDRDGAYFHVDLTGMSVPLTETAIAEEPERRYRSGLVRHRLHQARFRQAVLRAYKSRCSVCRLRRAELVDAAHIVSDAEGGRPVVPNGLALCRLHHAAFDRHILGIRPDLRVVVRRDVLEDADGPMLVHGLQGFHDSELVVPTRPAEQPDRSLLELRYENFRRAG
jgi:putative restriction endonuclease